ncbi:MAG: hypothetical protein QOF20_1393, partial [Acidimicrobiaceae bacterium]|nr:hypothetical protein [Acidimicrobiaceae bacterium]
NEPAVRELGRQSLFRLAEAGRVDDEPLDRGRDAPVVG